MMEKFSEFPDNARVWIYQSPVNLNPEQEKIISQHLSDFVSSWAAHGTKLSADFDILYHRFVMLVVNEEGQEATGCSIDDSVAIIRNISNHIGVDLLDRFQVAYKVGNEVRSEKMGNISALVDNGVFTPETIVFNNMLTNLGEVRTQWEGPAANGWQARFFKTKTA